MEEFIYADQTTDTKMFITALFVINSNGKLLKCLPTIEWTNYSIFTKGILYHNENEQAITLCNHTHESHK